MPFLLLAQASAISYTDNSLSSASSGPTGRVARINNPQIPDPNEQTIDGRSAAIERIVQELRVANPKPIDGYLYETRVRNGSTKPIEIVFWKFSLLIRRNVPRIVALPIITQDANKKERRATLAIAHLVSTCLTF